jgi:peptidoglycan/LPS O-acetylase OafA/YrhL
MALKFKVMVYIGAWLAALVATDPTLGFWALAWMFPLGLYSFFFPEHHLGPAWALSATVGIYLVHAVFYFRARTTRSGLILAGVLVALLLCNVAGCRQLIHTH